MSDAVEAVHAGVLSALAGLAGEISTTDDGSLSFVNEGCVWSVRVVELAAGLEMVSMTCVLAWDVQLDEGLRGRTDEARRLVQFGSVELVDRGEQADLLLQYVFPAGGLAPAALTTMLLLILGGAADARELALG
ncbi:hypothetical protein [Tomitella biformata]|uniref:hypothetical protein n=1 Tax=Tomitella biformata TaxID=630403 RepID=UPI0004640F5F|nr:hypothetical protein [Tomitella biformata]